MSAAELMPVFESEAAAWPRRPRAWTVDPATQRRVLPIVRSVRRGGDRALLRWARALDGLEQPLAAGADEMAAAWRALAPELRQALRLAHRHIRAMARRQMPRGWKFQVAPGVWIGQQVRPLASVGCYVPAGRHPLPSTVLMTAAVARVAGVARVVVACPRPDATVLAAAHLAGVSAVYRMGGAQAIAALAYGTKTVAAVDKIVGPGNRFVTAAKQAVRADCEIDFAAGPSEVVVVAGAGARADWIAADLVAQAEHDPDAVAWLLTDSRQLAQAVQQRVEARSAGLMTARRALRRHGAIVVTRGLDAALALANRLGPEHLVVPPALAAGVTCAGSVFVGAYAAVAAGDYATGPNHVLPTAGGARARGGLSAADFVRVITVQRLSARGLRRVGPAAARLAAAEGLTAHAASLLARMAPPPRRAR